MSPNEIADALEQFIRREFRVGDEPGFSREAHLYDSGFVDSIGVMELIAFLESRFAAQLEDRDIFSEDFTTINGISRVVSASLAQRGSHTAPLAAAE